MIDSAFVFLQNIAGEGYKKLKGEKFPLEMIAVIENKIIIEFIKNHTNCCDDFAKKHEPMTYFF